MLRPVWIALAVVKALGEWLGWVIFDPGGIYS